MSNKLPTAYEIANNERARQLEKNENLPFGMESGDPDGLYALEMGGCTAKLMPGPEFNDKLYRGQSEIYNPCRPSLYRDSLSLSERVINKMRFLQFKENIKDLPNIIQFSNAKILHYRLFVDYCGLAQHYGLNTPLLDFSSDPFVAAFFATTYYDCERRKYFPIEDGSHKGIFYCFDLKLSKGFSPTQADIVGAQPFFRPIKQKAFSVKVSENNCLHQNPNVMYQEFRHDKEASHKIYELFEGGNVLIPQDPVSDMADKVRVQEEFSEDVFVRSLSFLNMEDSADRLRQDILRKGIAIVEASTNYSFSTEDLVLVNNAWEEIKADIDSRLCIRPVLVPVQQE
nr:FRG domain-containing protein [Halomonas sp.]